MSILAGTKLHAIKSDEGGKLLRYYCSKVQEACQLVRLPSKVSAAAVLFFQRVYVHASLLDHNPEDLFLPCIYLACKASASPSNSQHTACSAHKLHERHPCSTADMAGTHEHACLPRLCKSCPH